MLCVRNGKEGGWRVENMELWSHTNVGVTRYRKGRYWFLLYHNITTLIKCYTMCSNWKRRRRGEDMELQNQYLSGVIKGTGMRKKRIPGRTHFIFKQMFAIYNTTLNKMQCIRNAKEKKGEGEDMEPWNQYNLGRGYKCNRNGGNKNRTPFVFDVNIEHIKFTIDNIYY